MDDVTPQGSPTEDDRRRIGFAREAFESAWQGGRGPRIEDFLPFVAETLREALLLELVHVEIVRRQAQGENAAPAEYVTRFPNHAEAIGQRLKQLGIEESTHSLRGASTEPSRVAEHTQSTQAAAAASVKPAAEVVSFHKSVRDVPIVFGRYRIERELGRGGMGVVFLARDQQLDRLVALKIPYFDDRNDGESIERFYREARAMATVQHPNLCPIYDVGQIGEWRNLTMAYIEGDLLSTRLREQGPMELLSAVTLLRKLASAVHKAHEAGIVHRDLKPSNIMLTSDHEPVIMDFGLARRERTSESELTQTGAVMGTPAYMAPEQVDARRSDIGPATDVYALGVILYQLITGRRPFEGTVATVLVQIVTEDATPPSQWRADLPAELDAICRKAIARSTADRYQSAADFARDLGRFLAHCDGAATLQLQLPLVAPAVLTDTSKKSAPDGPSVSRTRREAELRQVTVAYFSYDLGDSSLLETSSVHSEALHEQAQAFSRFVGERVTAFGGVTVTSAGQEVIACFGFPQAYEDASQRAIRAALLIQRELEAARSTNTQLPPASQTWAAIHSGEAIAELLGPNASTSISLIGEARNVAGRLNAATPAGTIVISPSTHQRVALFFECESLGAQRLRGIAEPVELFKVVREAASRNRVELVDPGNLTPLVGRDTELTILKDRWEHALEELGQIVLLIGDAGLGKSRLIRELREHVLRSDDTDAAIIEWRCSQYHQNTSYYPIVDYLWRLLALEGCPPAQQLDKIVSYLRDIRLESAQNVSLLCTLLGIPTGARFPPLSLSPQRHKERNEELLLTWLKRLVEISPVLFIVEDLHWVDPSTVELLERHVHQFECGRTLCVLTFRPEFETPWRSKPHQTQIALNRLTKRQVAEMMRKRTHQRDIPEPILRQVIDRTDGVPLFVEEFANVIVESGVLERSSYDDSSLLRIIPATLHELLLSRLDRIAADREIIQLAATVGREFNYELLAAACTLSESELQRELEKLVRAEILFQKGQGAEACYIFKHALLQDAAYRSMLTKKRQACHQRIAEILESRFPSVAANQPDLLAQHFGEAGAVESAVKYWGLAGHRAQQRSANHEAISDYRHALQLLATLPESPRRDELELGLTVPLGVSLLAAKGYANPEAGPVFDRARLLSERVGDPATRFYILWGSWAWRLVRSELNECREFAQRILELGREQPDPSWTCEAHFVPQVVHFYAGEFGPSREHGEAAIRLFDPAACVRHTVGTGQDVRSGVLSFHALALWALGYPDQAVEQARAAVSLSRGFHHPMSLSFALHHLAWTLIYARRWQEASEVSAEAHRVASEQGLALWIGSSELHAGICASQLGDVADGLRQMTEGFERYTSTGARCVVPMYLTMIADGHRLAGQLDEARNWIERSFRFASEHDGQNHHLAETHRVRGDIWLAFDKSALSEASACYERAIEVARQQQALGWELRATMSLGKARRATETVARLRHVYERFREGFDTPDLRDARRMLEDE